MTSSTTGDRRWGTTRRSGMTILGKVAVPKPINLPSQRLENQGLDPNVEIVPKGTLSWGSKSSLNAWGTSSLSPRTESGPGSPSHLSNRPSSGGSVTRPSTADSNKAHDSSSSVAWDSNSRPSSASGVFPSNQPSVALQRPHSADTRPGSSQLSRFAEPVSETSATWGQHVAPEKLGVAPSKNDGFSLTSGDFPSLGAEKDTSEKSTRPQDAGPHARPPSSSGRSVEGQGVDCTEEANDRIGDANSWRRENQPYSEDAPRHCREEGQLDSRGSQSYPNANFPPRYDAWRGPPVNNHQGGGWYGGNHPYGAPMGPGGFHMDPFPFYPTQVPPAPGHGAGPRGNHANNERMFRPPMLDSYVHPRMQTRPGFYVGPAPHEGYYGPPMGYGSPSNRDLPFAGRPTGPHAYNNHSGQGGYDTPGSSVSLERNESSHSQETQRPYKVLLKHQDGRFGEDNAKREEFLGNRLPNAEKIAQQMQTSRNERREIRNDASGEVQPVKAELAAPGDPSLIQKIEGLNAKTRTNDGWQNSSSVVNRDEQESQPRTLNSGNSANKVSARNHRTGHASDSKNSSHYNQGDSATNKNAEPAAMGGTSIFRRPTQQTQGRADPQTKRIVNSEGNDAWQKTTVMSGSSHTTLATNTESFREVNVDDSLDTESIRRPGSGISADPKDNQRSTMRELARQRAQQRQKEEEERARDQRAKALAKLEELNRRSQIYEEGSVKNMEAASNASPADMPTDPGSHSSNATNSVEPTGGSGKNTTQNTRTSTEYANNVGPSQQDNLPRDGGASKQKRLGYKQKQNIIFEKKPTGSSVATAEVFDVVPSPEVVNEGVSSNNSDMPATSTVSAESTFPKRKNNRNGKKKHKAEETATMNTTRVAVGKETKSGDESIETARARAAEIELGSVSVPSLDIKVSGDSSEQISSFTNEESQNRAKNNWKSQHVRRTQRNSLVNKPAEKFSGNNAVIWAPVHPQQKADVSTGGGSQTTVPEFGTSSKSQHQGQTSSKSKRVEIERYVPKPIVKEMAEQIVSKNLVTSAPDMSENVNQKENRGGEGTGILQPSGSTAGKSGSPSKSRHGNGRQGKHGREHASWHQRGSGAPTKSIFIDGDNSRSDFRRETINLMKALLNPESSFCLSSISSSQIKRSLHFNGLSSSCLRFPLTDFAGRLRRRKLTGGLCIKAVLDSAMMEQLGLKESDVKNPALSSTYRGSEIPKPNLTVLDAQARVCTGPTQTRPLSEEQAFKVFDTILRSARGELKDEEPVSKAQLGAFFAGMTIRANAFPEETQWSEGEKRAMDVFWPLLVRALPPDVLFIADPEGSLLGTGNSVGPTFVGNETREMRLVGALREILAGGHLGYEEVKGVLRDVLPLETEGSLNSGVSESLLSAFLIGQRMNRETDRELKAYCLAFDDEHGAPPVADVKSLTHYGEPYDGNTRFFRSTLFVAAVRSCCGESSLLHGVEWMPPKGGVTEEQMLKFMGANTHLSVQQAKELIEDEKAGFAYLSLREARPSLYSLIEMREHIKKRPPLATTEKVQQFVRATGKEAIVAGFYHEGYEEPLLMLMRRRGVHSGLVVKGEEGALSMTTRVRAASASKGFPVNYCSGFRSLSSDTALEADGVSRQSFNLEVDARNYGFEPTETPRTDRSVSKNIELGLAALRGEKGAAYDRIVLNAGIVDHLLGSEGAEDVAVAMERAKEAIDSGKALKKLLNYIEISRKIK